MKNLIVITALLTILFTSCKKEIAPVASEGLIEVKTAVQLNEITSSGVSMVFYHATHCSTCEMQRPTVELIPKNASVKDKAKFAQVDFDFYRPVFESRGISSFPHIIIYKDGVEKSRISGSGHTEEEIVGLINLALTM